MSTVGHRFVGVRRVAARHLVQLVESFPELLCDEHVIRVFLGTVDALGLRLLASIRG